MNTSSNPSWQAAFSLLTLRLFAAYEFLESGLEKWNGENWFADINSQFPFPFNLLPDTVNWNLAMWAELVLPALLIVGLALIYLVVLFPVLLQGAGGLSLDALLKKRCCRIKHFL